MCLCEPCDGLAICPRSFTCHWPKMLGGPSVTLQRVSSLKNGWMDEDDQTNQRTEHVIDRDQIMEYLD